MFLVLAEHKKRYKYYVSGHYPSSCLYLKTPSYVYFKTQRYGTGFCLTFQVKPTQLAPISRASFYLWRQGLALLILAEMSRFYLKTETESSLQNVFEI
jgi:hypothetical protein